QAEVEGVLAGAAELERLGAGAEHEAADDAARAKRQRAVAAAAEFDRSKSSRGIDCARIEHRAAALEENADPAAARADVDRSGVDDGIAAAETADVDTDREAGADGDGAAVGDGIGIAEHDDADGIVAEKNAAA